MKKLGMTWTSCMVAKTSVSNRIQPPRSVLALSAWRPTSATIAAPLLSDLKPAATISAHFVHAPLTSAGMTPVRTVWSNARKASPVRATILVFLIICTDVRPPLAHSDQ
jgi:hypothetical protein